MEMGHTSLQNGIHKNRASNPNSQIIQMQISRQKEKFKASME